MQFLLISQSQYHPFPFIHLQSTTKQPYENINILGITTWPYFHFMPESHIINITKSASQNLELLLICPIIFLLSSFFISTWGFIRSRMELLLTYLGWFSLHLFINQSGTKFCLINSPDITSLQLSLSLHCDIDIFTLLGFFTSPLFNYPFLFTVMFSFFNRYYLVHFLWAVCMCPCP